MDDAERTKLEERLVVIEREIDSMDTDCIADKSDSAFDRYRELVSDKRYIEQELAKYESKA